MTSQKPKPIISAICPVCGAYLDMRDLGQLVLHMHDQEIEISEGPEPPRQGRLH
jgi:hypothetical protein